jgi:8-oxo-dGTP pyrophosphatase MutT (NUDIX family)
MTEIVNKVAAYITCEGHLLVFTQPAAPEAGVQIPSGTVKDGEDLEMAVLREAMEESGLKALTVRAYLGERTYDMRAITGADRKVRRHFFHLDYAGPISLESWRNWEEDPSDGEEDSVEFELRWVRYPEEVPELAAEFSDLLHMLQPDV